MLLLLLLLLLINVSSLFSVPVKFKRLSRYVFFWSYFGYFSFYFYTIWISCKGSVLFYSTVLSTFWPPILLFISHSWIFGIDSFLTSVFSFLLLTVSFDSCYETGTLFLFLESSNIYFNGISCFLFYSFFNKDGTSLAFYDSFELLFYYNFGSSVFSASLTSLIFPRDCSFYYCPSLSI